ncbi:MAG TPA: hypothetical protein PK200_06330 [Spirochaetota bacterium]|nr:hypothetical protein [Spirochaetota bacterium]HQO02556.1 hypothetical protein [Spirochaetota bacterium]HQP50225.1 hypothetical protein [Spirochaetota bacterium]
MNIPFPIFNGQARYRKKHQRIRCPRCNAMSRVMREFAGGLQFRMCRNGHFFVYDYLQEAALQQKTSYKLPLK